MMLLDSSIDEAQHCSNFNILSLKSLPPHLQSKVLQTVEASGTVIPHASDTRINHYKASCAFMHNLYCLEIHHQDTCPTSIVA